MCPPPLTPTVHSSSITLIAAPPCSTVILIYSGASVHMHAILNTVCHRRLWVSGPDGVLTMEGMPPADDVRKQLLVADADTANMLQRDLAPALWYGSVQGLLPSPAAAAATLHKHCVIDIMLLTLQLITLGLAGRAQPVTVLLGAPGVTLRRSFLADMGRRGPRPACDRGLQRAQQHCQVDAAARRQQPSGPIHPSHPGHRYAAVVQPVQHSPDPQSRCIISHN
jgi:hypothetical protein